MQEILKQLKTKLQKQKESASLSSFFFLLIFVDFVSKYFAKAIFRNDVFAFSLPVPIFLIYLVYVSVLFFIVRFVLASYSKFSQLDWIAWALVFAGAVSNISERIFHGYVTDWIYLWTGVFNLADGYIIVGILILFFSGSNIKLKISNFK